MYNTIRNEKYWGSSRLFYLALFNFIGLNLIETMSMDKYMEIVEIGSRMPWALVSLSWSCTNRKRMLSSSEYNSEF